MANLLTTLFRRPTDPGNEIARYTLSDYIQARVQAIQSLSFPGFSSTGTIGGRPVEQLENSYTGYAAGAYKTNTVVAACMRVRRDLFSQAAFCWREMTDNGPGRTFRDDALAVLERPWPNGTTGELLTRMITDVDLCGNSYIVNEGDRLRWLRPDWVSIVLTGDPQVDPDVDVAGYIYAPGGQDLENGVPYTPDRICHFSPQPDPLAQYRGQTWLTPAIRDIQADTAATEHKLAFFTNGATLGPIFRVPAGVTREQFKELVADADAAHVGSTNAYRPFYVGGGVDVTLAGASMAQLEFRATQGAGETRVAALAGVHPVLVGLSEGLAGSSLNSGNFAAARRATADITLWKLWIDVCRALSAFVEVPPDAQLWVDERQVPFLREDARDQAEITKTKILSIESGIRAGFKPDPLVTTVDTNDITALAGAHSNLFSVQLQPAGAANPATPPELDLTRPQEALARAYLARHAIATTEFELDDDWYPAQILGNGRHHRDDDELEWELERAGYRPGQPRFGKGVYLGKIPVAGRWRLLGGPGDIKKIFEALDAWGRGDEDSPDDPLQGFTVPKLREAATTMGLAGHGDRHELTGRILDDVRKKVRGHRQALRDLPHYTYGKGVDRPQARDQAGKLRDIEIYQGPGGLSIRLLDESDRGGEVVATGLADWLAVYRWARRRKLAALAGWVEKYHPVSRSAAARRRRRLDSLVRTLRGYDTYAQAELLLHGLEPAEVADLYRHLGGKLDLLPRAPTGRVPNQAVIEAVMAGWPRYSSAGTLDVPGNPLAVAAAGSTLGVPDVAEGSVYGSPSDFAAGSWGEAGFSVGRAPVPLEQLL